VNGQILDQIIAILKRDGSLTPTELLIACKEEAKMDTFAFCQAMGELERVGLIERYNAVNRDHSGSSVYRVTPVRPLDIRSSPMS